MCLVKVEKMPKLQTACTTVIGEGMVVTTDSDEVHQARKAWWNCCWATIRWIVRYAMPGGECELQDMTFSYGAAESKFMETKNHKEEQQWSPVVYLRPATLHSLLSLRAGVRRGHGRVGAGRAEPRRQLDHRSQ